MKHFIYLSIASLLFSCSSPEQSEEKKAPALAKGEWADSAKVKAAPPEGEYVEKYNNGIIKMHGYIAGGMRHGQWASFYPSGNPWSEVVYIRGKRNGRTTSWHENGQLRYSGFYKDDAEAGKWKYFDESGKLAQEVDYK